VWLKKVESIAVSGIAKNIGMSAGRSGSCGPCPYCGAEQRGSTDKRGPIGFRRDDLGWKCHKCGHGGSGVDLVCYSICGKSFKEASDGDKDKTREWFESAKHLDVVTPEKAKKMSNARPPAKEVRSLWKNSLKLHEVPKDDPVLSFLLSRKLDLDALARTGVARVTPSRNAYPWPKWWPGGRSMTWRLIVPAFDAEGSFCSLHARAVCDTNGAPKTLWPSGFQAGGLFMPNRHAVKMMQGKPEGIDGVLFVEGITDFIKASSEAERESIKLAVLGGTSGSFKSAGKLNIPAGIDIYVGTDPDQKGDEYASTIQMQLGSRACYRLPLGEVDGGNGERP
jgi:hypothetical protein